MKISKHIAILLSFLLLVSNIGLAVNVHYCAGNIASVSFDYKVAEPCVEITNTPEKTCCAEQDSHDDCCKNSKVEIKKSISDNIIVKNIQLNLSSFSVAEIYNFSFFNVGKQAIVDKKEIFFYCDNNAPPFYKLYSQLIFYA